MTFAAGLYELNWIEHSLQPDPIYGKPIARSSHGVSYLSETQQLFVYGGENVARTPLEESYKKQTDTSDDGDDASTVTVIIYAWLGDLKTQTWKALTATEREGLPPLRIAHAQAFHEATQTVYIFGGRAGIQMQENAMNDLWSWSAKTHEWTQLSSSSPTSSSGVVPEARSFHRMVCIHDKLYVFGGCGQTSGRLADLHCFDLTTKTWKTLPPSELLKGRGGPNVLPLQSGKSLAVIAGFTGQESKDGHVFDLTQGKWSPSTMTSELEPLRPRSVCVSAAFPEPLGVAVLFGGEVDPSERGHEGAGGFANDVVLLKESNGAVLETVQQPPVSTVAIETASSSSSSPWPGPRGWSAADAGTNSIGDEGWLFLFGGLAGDDQKPLRLEDLWQLKISKKAN